MNDVALWPSLAVNHTSTLSPVLRPGHVAAQAVVVDAGIAVLASPPLNSRVERVVLAAAVDLPVHGHGAERALGVDLDGLRVAVGDVGNVVGTKSGAVLPRCEPGSPGPCAERARSSANARFFSNSRLDVGLGVLEDEAVGRVGRIGAVGAADRRAGAAVELDRVGERAERL